MKENEIFKQMLDWIYANTELRNQAEIAHRTGINEVTISRVLNGRIKKVKRETLRKLNTAFGGVFNPEWIRGESSIMLTAELASVSRDTRMPETILSQKTQSPFSSEISTIINTIISAKEESIKALKCELAAKEETIATLRSQLTDKDNLVAEKERYIISLQRQLRDIRATATPQKDFTTGLPYHVEVADREYKQQKP